MPSLSRSAWSWPLTLLLTGAPWAPVARGAEVVVPVPSPYSYDDASLRQLQVRGAWGRYLTFTGHSVIEWPAKAAEFQAGDPGTVRCNSSRCWREGYVAPSFRGGTPAGSLRHFFQYQLDCSDRTFDRLGDVRLPGHYPRGWQPVLNDPVALAVANAWCSRLAELPKGP